MRFTGWTSLMATCWKLIASKWFISHVAVCCHWYLIYLFPIINSLIQHGIVTFYYIIIPLSQFILMRFTGKNIEKGWNWKACVKIFFIDFLYKLWDFQEIFVIAVLKMKKETKITKDCNVSSTCYYTFCNGLSIASNIWVLF